MDHERVPTATNVVVVVVVAAAAAAVLVFSDFQSTKTFAFRNRS